jgi:hypothetical protein
MNNWIPRYRYEDGKIWDRQSGSLIPVGGDTFHERIGKLLTKLVELNTQVLEMDATGFDLAMYEYLSTWSPLKIKKMARTEL